MSESDSQLRLEGHQARLRYGNPRHLRGAEAEPYLQHLPADTDQLNVFVSVYSSREAFDCFSDLNRRIGHVVYGPWPLPGGGEEVVGAVDITAALEAARGGAR